MDMTAKEAYRLSQKGEKFCQEKVDYILDKIKQCAHRGETNVTIKTSKWFGTEWPFYETHEIVSRLTKLGYNVHCYHSVSKTLEIYWNKI